MSKEGNGIDWEEQWRNFAPSFYDGASHIDLSPYDPKCMQDLLLKAGGGFGDLSHPTTRLCLILMAPFVKGATIIDIGCGSGILMLSALLMGADNAIGIDIEQDALEHAAANAKLNHLDMKTVFTKKIDLLHNPLCLEKSEIYSQIFRNCKQFRTSRMSRLEESRRESGIKTCEKRTILPGKAGYARDLMDRKKIRGTLLLLMNMISSEQKMAWSAQKPLHQQSATLITSGILTEQRETYLNWACQQGWKLIREASEEGWSGFVFSQEGSSPS